MGLVTTKTAQKRPRAFKNKKGEWVGIGGASTFTIGGKSITARAATAAELAEVGSLKGYTIDEKRLAAALAVKKGTKSKAQKAAAASKDA